MEISLPLIDELRAAFPSCVPALRAVVTSAQVIAVLSMGTLVFNERTSRSRG